ncbi:hypothetical protein Hanom_Chr06g00500701 [Helianthus anomalus]
MAPFALRTLASPLESRLCIFDLARVVKHKGCKDQVVGDVGCMRMTLWVRAQWRMMWQSCARVHKARGCAHGAWAWCDVRGAPK